MIMKNTITYLSLSACLLFSCCDKNDNEKPKLEICNYQSYNPPISIEDYSSYNVDIDGDKINDLTFVSNSNKFGISINSSSKEIEITKGIEPFSGSYHIINLNDTIDLHFDWSISLPLAGIVDNVYYGERFNYLGIRKKVDANYYYGWLAVKTTNSSFKLTELYFLKSFKFPVLAGVINDTCSLE